MQHTLNAPTIRAGMSFLAQPGEVADWRMVAIYGAAADAGLIDALPGTAEELAAHCGVHPHSVRVVLDALGAWSIVDRDASARYTAGAGAPEANDAATLWLHVRALRNFAGLDAALRDPFAKRAHANGTPPDTFQTALAAVARRRAPSLADAILARMGRVQSMVDLGGGHGEYAIEFARRGVAATLMDRPPVIAAARRRGAVTAAGVELFEGDFFEVLPPATFDLVLVAGVTHTYDAEHNLRMYERVRPILSAGGALALVTMLRRQHAVATLFAVMMLYDGGGADTHSEDDYRTWLHEAGYGMVDVFSVPGEQEQGVVLARPR